jgi:hypothetical protein
MLKCASPDAVCMYTERFQAAECDPCRKWSMIRDVLHSTQPADIMSAGESKRLCDTFVEYFTVKIRTIKSSIKSRLAGVSRVYDELYADPMHTGETFSALQPPSVDEVTKLINAMPAKSSPVDKIPTSIIKSCVDVFAGLTTLSFHEGVFPAIFCYTTAKEERS